MNSLKDVILNGEVITVDNFKIIDEYMSKYPEDYIMQYNVDPTWLLDEYRFGEYKGEIVIYKIKPFAAANIAQIELLPLNIDGKEFSKEVKALGMNLRLNPMDYLRCRTSRNSTKPVDTSGGDFVYSKLNNHNLDGKENANIRLGLNRFTKNPDFDIKFVKPSEITDSELDEVKALINVYKEYKKELHAPSGYTFHINKYTDNFRSWAKEFDEKRIMQIIRYKGEIKAFSISEYINKWNISMPDRKSMLHELPSMQHAFRAMNWLDIDYWVRKLPDSNEIYFNFGSAGNSSKLFETKTRMKPKLIMINYKFKEVAELDKDIFNIIRGNKK